VHRISLNLKRVDLCGVLLSIVEHAHPASQTVGTHLLETGHGHLDGSKRP
jgi:hypothetical protein